MKAFTVAFANPDKVIDYNRLLRILQYSWSLHNPEIPLEVHVAEPPSWRAKKFGWDANTKKLEIWAKNFNQDTIFLDCDMLCIGPMAGGFDLIDNVGYTRREGADFILNGGVHYFKYNARSQAFMKEFVKTNRAFIKEHLANPNVPVNDLKLWGPWHKKYDGLNQGAFGHTMENFMSADPMPEIYNLCSPWIDWHNAKMIHIKSKLRRDCLTGVARETGYTDLINLWRACERDSEYNKSLKSIKQKPARKGRLLKDQVTVIMRSVRERTEQVCYKALCREVDPNNVYILRNLSLSESTRVLCEIALKENRKWTLIADADYIPKPGFVKELWDIAKTETGKCIFIKGVIQDKFLMEHRGDQGGPMLQRTKQLKTWLDILDKVDNGMTTEAQCHRWFYKRGYYAHRSKILVTLHGYEQYYRDIFRSCFVYGRKHKRAMDLIGRWKKMADTDRDYAVAAYAFQKGLSYNGHVLADINHDYGFLQSPFAQIEKEPLINTENEDLWKAHIS